MRGLEAQNRKLADELDKLKTKWGKETEQIKAMFQAELDEARAALDEAEKEKARLEIKVASLEEQIEELRVKSVISLYADTRLTSLCPRRRGGAFWNSAIRPSVCPPVCLSHGAAALCYRHAGCRHLSYVQTVDGCRSAASRTAIYGGGYRLAAPGRQLVCVNDTLSFFSFFLFAILGRIALMLIGPDRLSWTRDL